MKTLILGLLFFGAMLYGLKDVKPFKRERRTVRRTPSRQSAPLPAEPTVAPPSYRRYRP
ncbi:MAG TPA: hypothetical protein V6D47_01020 [Oscillatoriaceae cyanobacterium]